MSGNGQRRRPSPWFLAISASLFLHAVWAAWLPSSGPGHEGSGAPRGPLVRYDASRTWRELRANNPGDARLAQSPTLFALPAPAGFSGPSLDPFIRQAPPWAVERPGALLAPDRALDLAGLLEPREGSGVQSRPSAPRLGAAPVFKSVVPPPPEQLRVVWSEDFPAIAVRELAATNAVWRDAAPWELAASVRYDGQGAVREVLLDPVPGIPAPRRAAAVRLLFALPVSPAAGDRIGRVTIRYTGPAAGGSA